MPTRRNSSIQRSSHRSRSLKPLPSVPKSCQVTLLLAMGQQYHLTLPLNDPILHQLFQVMWAKTQATATAPHLLQIPVNNRQAALCISSQDIIGIVTEPALFIQPQTSAQDKSPQNTSAQQVFVSQPLFQGQPASEFAFPEFPAKPAQVHSSQSTIFLPAHVMQLEQFLSVADHAAALEIALDKQADFVGSTTTTSAENYRQSAILYATRYPEFYHLLRQQILALVPTVLQQLQMPEFEISEVEMQMTAHNDGCFYKVHNDSGDIPTRSRYLTYVYYFSREPQGFSGGELKIYDTELQQGSPKIQKSSQIITPRNNSIVFFDSRLMHEVLPVTCNSREFADSRFTLNGWLRRADS